MIDRPRPGSDSRRIPTSRVIARDPVGAYSQKRRWIGASSWVAKLARSDKHHREHGDKRWGITFAGMTRMGGASRNQEWVDPFAADTADTADAEEAVLRVLQQAEGALSATEVKQVLRTEGVAKADADRAWTRVQKRIRSHEHVVVEGGYRYRWTAHTHDESATGQAAMPFLRALAELAIEVEELTVNQASARAMIHRVRARVKRMGLEPIDRAGELSTLDRTRHEPIGRPISDGTPVIVVRPGYIWKAPTGDVLIVRAIVQDRS